MAGTWVARVSGKENENRVTKCDLLFKARVDLQTPWESGSAFSFSSDDF